MKLWSIQVENYRSIVKTQSLKLDDGLTVILGPNNEGKSNLLRAIVLAMECLRSIRTPIPAPLRSGTTALFRLPRGSYDWAVDFPLKLQAKHPDGQTVLTLEFTLSENERAEFKNACGSTINDHLPIEIRLHAHGVQFKVKKPGLGGKSYRKKSQEIASFVSRKFDFQYIPAIRPSDLSLEVVASLMDRELALLAEDDSYKAALKTIEELQKPVFERLGADVQRYLKQLLPSIKAVRISTQTDKYRSRFRSPQFVVNDGTATELEAKGDGIKSLVAISLMRASKTGREFGDLVVAIEEPESHLHPAAVRQLSVVLQEMAQEHQVIVTTHSPLLVTRERMESNIIVSKSKATPATAISAVRESLGVRVEDSLNTAEFVVLLEGKTDVKALTAVFSARSSDFASMVKKGRVVFDHMEGTGNVAYKIRTLQLSVASPILITDDDKAGRECAKKAKDGGDLPEKFYFCWRRTKPSETELEDLIDTDCYWKEIETQFGVVLDRTVFLASNEKWSSRMQARFEASGKPWNSSVEHNVKAALAQCVAAKPSNAITSDHIELVDNVIGAVVSLMSKK